MDLLKHWHDQSFGRSMTIEKEKENIKPVSDEEGEQFITIKLISNVSYYVWKNTT